MASRKRKQQEQASRARAGKAAKRQHTIEVHTVESSESEDEEVTSWTGGVNNPTVHEIFDSDSDGWESSDNDEIAEMEGDELFESLQKSMAHEMEELRDYFEVRSTVEVKAPDSGLYSKLCKANLSAKEWKKAEANRALGYNGQSARTERRRQQAAREKAEKDKLVRASESASFMRSFLQPKPVPADPDHVREDIPAGGDGEVAACNAAADSPGIFTGYISDISDDDEDDNPELRAQDPLPLPSNPSPSFVVRVPPAPKRRRHEIPVREARKIAQAEKAARLRDALVAIEKRIASTKQKNKFESGREGLQAYRARAIQSHLHMVVNNHRKHIDASERAAESQGFSRAWGGRLVRRWVRKWVGSRELPKSARGRHTKVHSLLEDPTIRAELRSYLRSNKWSTDPARLQAYLKDTFIPTTADKFIKNIINREMPAGLKRYLELELFPRIQYRAVGKGVSMATARRFLRKEGFRFTEHKKALYYDGHERPDVVDYRQNVFLPAMERHRERLVEYTVGNVEVEVEKIPSNFVERRLVMVPHDEMTAQQNDGKKKSWVLDGEHALKKKGVGRGLHTSGVICATKGFLPDAVQIIEYGKNYDGYWTGEMFVKQLTEKIIPAFEKAHGPGFQALFLVDNSQGHAAYPEDALLATRMNMRPGGKQARMRDGWFMCDGIKVIQPMIFPPDHHKFPNQPKGMREVLTERGLFHSDLLMVCNPKNGGCSSNSCCAKQILEHQPDFREQKSLVQEVIEAAGHLCIFLPKFHCELNYIEFFWGAVKQYLRNNCDYTFDGLKDNLSNALQSVALQTIRRWEHRMYRWMDAYRQGLSAKDAQFKVKEFSSAKYRSHRRIPESLARQFDH